MNRRQLLCSAAAAPLAATAFSAAAAQQKQIKITGIETDVLKRPPGTPFYDAIHAFGTENGSVVLRLHTDAGITGWASSSFGMIAGGPKVVQTILEQEVKPALLGKDPSFPRRIRADLWQALEYQGVGGVAQFAIAAVDIAVWDILGKSAGLPVYKMLGAYRDRMPVYSMCGWYYDNDDDLSKFKRQISTAMEQGYQAVKMKVGRYSMDDDARRIRVALETMGKGKRLMVDANQVFNRNEALRRGRVYQELGCFWYEEPLPPQDMEGFALLAQSLDMRIATGENLNTKFAFADLIGRKAADVVQPDNRRAGGVTEWMEIAALADAAGLELASHGGGSTNLNMLLAMPNAIYMETSGAQKMVNGEVAAPEAPGMSSEVSEAEIKRYKVG
ncbi:MAG TPA: mandelate racemase/muconate lactonizing enzyme family protein [Candidatus Sulfopaludibacter sp.]|jgi:L-alanine-DL-glutamate epimerase-like enolase superfamily enzyme|nr:mandelate racemase/muconate lactonizing enzyme family protein [Candidatus Sulfopaludibacter sp.]